MFGYIQPLKCELKVREYDYYRAAYCGLCNSLRTHCGIKARFIVNYDFVFVALLLSSSCESGETSQKERCIACPTGRMCIHSSVYDKVAKISVILTYLKLCDNAKDSTGIKKLFKAWLPMMLLKRAYVRACSNMTEYTKNSVRLYDELNELEKRRVPSLDGPADKFALMLSLIADEAENSQRVLKEIFYHIGRFVYIIDALDDFEDDFKKNEYNPIIERFKVEEAVLPTEVKKSVLLTLEDSRQAVLRAAALLPESKVKGLINNIAELGMNASVYRVLRKESKNE